MDVDVPEHFNYLFSTISYDKGFQLHPILQIFPFALHAKTRHVLSPFLINTQDIEQYIPAWNSRSKNVKMIFVCFCFSLGVCLVISHHHQSCRAILCRHGASHAPDFLPPNLTVSSRTGGGHAYGRRPAPSHTSRMYLTTRSAAAAAVMCFLK